MKAKTIKIILADGNRLFIDSLRAVIENSNLHIKVVDTAQNSIDAVEMVGKVQPDIIMLDINLPGMDCFKMLKLFRDRAPDTKTIILTANTDVYHIEESLRNKVSGYILKDIALTQLMTLLPLVNSKTIILSHELIPLLFERGSGNHNESNNRASLHSPLPVFSGHEKRLFSLITQGFSNREIAEKMHLAEQTVKNYVSNIYAKLGVHNRSQAILKGKNNSII